MGYKYRNVYKGIKKDDTMFKPYELLENVLIDIEHGLKENINAYNIARKYGLSETHLRRLFSFSFNQTISGYIRSRTLTASLIDLLETDSNVLDIAIDYGFGYEQTYIRSFKREFGTTPGNLRKTGQVVKIKPSLHLFDKNKLGDSAFFGPDFVMFPQFHIIGKSYKIPFEKSLEMAPIVGRQFWQNERTHIKNAVNPNVYIGFTRNINLEKSHSEYIPSVQVKNLKNIAEGYTGHTFETSMCARFRYIGQHHYYDINREVAEKMYNAIFQFTQNVKAEYVLSNDKVYFERIDTGLYDGNYCQMEWFTPITKKK